MLDKLGFPAPYPSANRVSKDTAVTRACSLDTAKLNGMSLLSRQTARLVKGIVKAALDSERVWSL